MRPTSLVIDDLHFTLRWSPRRKTLGITVERDGELVLAPPYGCELTRIEAVVRQRKPWIYEKLEMKRALRRDDFAVRFERGESFFYLGRTYRLALVEEQDQPLKLMHGWFRLRASERPEARVHFARWYRTHALPWLEHRVAGFTSRMDVSPERIDVLDLGHRWGSCNPLRGTVNFHWLTILLPPTIIDYIIVHELAHLHEPNHTPEFWERVTRVLPDFHERKRWLAQNGAEYSAINNARLMGD